MGSSTCDQPWSLVTCARITQRTTALATSPTKNGLVSRTIKPSLGTHLTERGSVHFDEMSLIDAEKTITHLDRGETVGNDE